ncbi:hypothetical protein BDDG_12604 [Blastomyces dermatitidis ATCC 18188]|uniref:Uncharacterized protein n=1 Tax=Ajellomyces dermatitidis (strain ATCC 18188 / CBS 674.68) TaxID=653446 RepID=A0A0J9HGD5_AJEDA|nr:hypothetical protein BDDG_12604 [Blastomyces dermatitidis ATCC 18188]
MADLRMQRSNNKRHQTVRPPAISSPPQPEAAGGEDVEQAEFIEGATDKLGQRQAGFARK